MMAASRLLTLESDVSHTLFTSLIDDQWEQRRSSLPLAHILDWHLREPKSEVNTMLDGMELGLKLCTMLEDHLEAQEAERRAVSLLAGGAAFESWLAFETRLLAENDRGTLGLLELVDDGVNRVPRYAICNEASKVDFSVLDVKTPDGDPLLALEFKLMHNNKNWKGKVEEVWEDIYPTGKRKAAMHPVLGRFSVVGVLGLVYRKPSEIPYPGQVNNLRDWRTQIGAVLTENQRDGRKRLQRVWASRELPISDPWLKPDAGSFFQLQLFAPA